eukprot:s450_g5.t1
MPEPWRKTGRLAANEHYIGLAPFTIVEAAAYHEDGSRMGHILLQLHRKDPLEVDGEDGITWGGHMLGVEDPYYLWWYESTFGKLEDRREAFFHFCRKPEHQCHFTGGYGNLIHVDVFRVLGPDECEKLRWVNLMRFAEGAPGAPVAGLGEVRPGAAGVTDLRSALEGAPPGPREAERDEPPRSPRPDGPKAKAKAGPKDEDEGSKEADDYGRALRKRKPMRQAESALKLRRTNKKKKKKAERKKREQKKARGAEDEDTEDTSDSSTDESVFHMAPLPEGIDRLKKTHLKKPGRLADLTLQRYRELLERGTGRGADQNDGEVLPPVGRAYLQQVYFVRNPVATLGQRTAREMRTIMLVVDYLAHNMVPAALDVLLQRQKALELSVEQQGWQQANLLELVDMEEARSYFTQELKAAQSQLRSDQRLGKGWPMYRQSQPWRPAPPQGETPKAKDTKEDTASLNEDTPRKGRKGKKGKGKGRW